MKTYKNYNQISIGLIAFALAVFGLILIAVPKEANAYYVKGYYTVTDSTTTTNNDSGNGSAYDENATPILTRISPTTVNQNTARSIDVYGNYFTPNSVVKIDGANKPTNFISENHLVVYLNQADTQYLGDRLVSVANTKTGAQSNARILKVVKPNSTTTAKKTGTVKKATLVKANTQTTTIPEDKILIIADRGTELYYLDQSSNYDGGDSNTSDNTLSANSFFATGGFMPSSFLQWVVLFILILLCVYLWRKIYVTDAEKNTPLKHH